MNHKIIETCRCSVFDDKNVSLQILSIHRILVEVESCFSKNGNFDAVFQLYQHARLGNFLFYVRVELAHMSQLKSTDFVMECNLNDLLFILRHHFELSKIVLINIEMISEESFKTLEKKFFDNKGCVSYDVYPSSKDDVM